MLLEKADDGLCSFLERYNRSWLTGDIENVRPFYSSKDAELIYFDNHHGNDTDSVRSHLELVASFLKHGKSTESGRVEEILLENIRMFAASDSACICSIARYKSHPVPGVRTTMYVEKEMGDWKIKHVHCSFEP